MDSELVILVKPDGTVSTLPFGDLENAGYPASQYVHLRELIDLTGKFAATVPAAGGLVVWVDGEEISCRRSLNLAASIAMAKVLGVSVPAIYGSLIITGGHASEPRSLSAQQAAEALEIFDLEVDEDIWSC